MSDRLTAHEEVIALLKDLPDQDADNVLQRIRSGTEITKVLNQVHTGNILLQMAVTPETRFRYELPYRPDIPEEYFPDNLYLKSMIYEAASLHRTPQSSASSEQSRFLFCYWLRRSRTV